MNIDSQLDKQLTDFICGWDRLEMALGHEAVIDVNLADKVQGKEYQNRDEVLRDIEYFLSCNEIRNNPLLLRKMKAHDYFLRQSMYEDISYPEYFQNTMGCVPHPIPEKKIQQLKERVVESWGEAGLAYNVYAHTCIQELDPPLPFDNIAIRLDSFYKDFFSQINTSLKVTADFSLTYSSLPDDSAFVAWISGNGIEYDVRLNYAEAKKLREPFLRLLAIHELAAHAVQFNQLRHMLSRLLWPNYMSYITVHEPIQFALEGLATSLHLFFPEAAGSAPFMKAAITHDHLSRLAIFNACYYALTSGNLEDSVHYLVENEVMREHIARSRLTFATSNKSVGYGYYQVYGPAMAAFADIAESHIDKMNFLRQVYQGYLMPEDIMEQNKNPAP